MFLSVNRDYFVVFQFLTAAHMKKAVFWLAAQCSLAEVYRRFRAIVLMMKAAGTSKTLAKFYQITRRNNSLRRQPSAAIISLTS
jgi:hypothetical protein